MLYESCIRIYKLVDIRTYCGSIYESRQKRYKCACNKNKAILDSEHLLGPALLTVQAPVRDLRNISSDPYSNQMIRHVRRKQTDHLPGICRWDIMMMLKALVIRKCVSSGLASYMFIIRCISITFCSWLLMCYHWISLRICSCISV